MENVNPEIELQHAEWLCDGYSAITTGDSSFSHLSGNESFFHLHHDIQAYAGTEAKYWDGVKETATRLYKQIGDILKRVREYFFGEGAKAAEESQVSAQEAITAMLDLGPSAPVPLDHPARNPATYIKPLEGGTEFQEVMKENGQLAASINKVKSVAEKVKNCDTVGKLRAVYNEMSKAANQGIKNVSASLKTTLTEAEQATAKLRNPKVPKDGDPKEVLTAIKQENGEIASEAKAGTKKSRIIGGVRNKLVGTLNQIASQSKKVKDAPPPSGFKG